MCRASQVSETLLGPGNPKMDIYLLLFQEADMKLMMNLGTKKRMRSMLGKKNTEKTGFISLAISTRNRLLHLVKLCT